MSEAWIIYQGTYEDARDVGIADSERTANALITAYYEKHGQPVFPEDRLWAAEEPLTMNEIVVRNDGSPVYYTGPRD